MAELLAPIRSIFEYVDMMPSSIAFRESIYVSPYTTVAHVVAMAFFAGLILMMDLRLMGVANMSTPFSQVQRRLFPLQMAAMAVAAATGLVLAFGDPLRFYSNIFFWTKMTMMALAGLNALAFHYLTYDTVPQWDSAARPPAAARLSGTISVFLWSCIILLGRLIPYNWFA